jgi:hypothetical protein
VLDRREVDHTVRDDHIELRVLERESVDARFDKLDLREPVAISQPRGLADLFVGEVEPDHAPGRADLGSGAEHIGSRARAEIEHSVARRERSEVEVVADSCKGRQGLGGDRIEQVARIPEAQRERPPEREVEFGFLFARHLAIHVLHLCLEHLAVDKRARVCLGQGLSQRHLVFGSYLVRAHGDLLYWQCWEHCRKL